MLLCNWVTNYAIFFYYATMSPMIMSLCNFIFDSLPWFARSLVCKIHWIGFNSSLMENETIKQRKKLKLNLFFNSHIHIHSRRFQKETKWYSKREFQLEFAIISSSLVVWSIIWFGLAFVFISQNIYSWAKIATQNGVGSSIRIWLFSKENIMMSVILDYVVLYFLLSTMRNESDLLLCVFRCVWFEMSMCLKAICHSILIIYARRLMCPISFQLKCRWMAACVFSLKWRCLFHPFNTYANKWTIPKNRFGLIAFLQFCGLRIASSLQIFKLYVSIWSYRLSVHGSFDWTANISSWTWQANKQEREHDHGFSTLYQLFEIVAAVAFDFVRLNYADY